MTSFERLDLIQGDQRTDAAIRLIVNEVFGYASGNIVDQMVERYKEDNIGPDWEHVAFVNDNGALLGAASIVHRCGVGNRESDLSTIAVAPEM